MLDTGTKMVEMPPRKVVKFIREHFVVEFNATSHPRIFKHEMHDIEKSVIVGMEAASRDINDIEWQEVWCDVCGCEKWNITADEWEDDRDLMRLVIDHAWKHLNGEV